MIANCYSEPMKKHGKMTKTTQNQVVFAL